MNPEIPQQLEGSNQNQQRCPETQKSRMTAKKQGMAAAEREEHKSLEKSSGQQQASKKRRNTVVQSWCNNQLSQREADAWVKHQGN